MNPKDDEDELDTELSPETLNARKRDIDRMIHSFNHFGHIHNVDSVAFHHYKLAISHLETAREHVALAKVYQMRKKASG